VKVRYVGRCVRGVEIPAAGVFVGHGETADIPAEIADGLLRQSGSWEKVAASPKKADKANKNESEAEA
jgi:hypothetical protein